MIDLSQTKKPEDTAHEVSKERAFERLPKLFHPIFQGLEDTLPEGIVRTYAAIKMNVLDTIQHSQIIAFEHGFLDFTMGYAKSLVENDGMGGLLNLASLKNNGGLVCGMGIRSQSGHNVLFKRLFSDVKQSDIPAIVDIVKGLHEQYLMIAGQIVMVAHEFDMSNIVPNVSTEAH